jgi:hydroxymethylbilane synthase
MMTPLPFLKKGIRLGSRKSKLALWQTHHIRDQLQAAWPGLEVEIQIISTTGDRVLDTPLPLIGGKGVFTAELEAALRAGAIDAAVHSLKDLPTESPPGLTIGATPRRVRPDDVLISRQGYQVDTLPPGAKIGTSSRRRAAQLLNLRPDLQIIDIRGNVPSRVDKGLAEDGPYDAIVLAYAGLERLGLLAAASQVLSLEQMLPAPGQGALAIQCRDETESLALLAPLNDNSTQAAVTAERTFLSGLGGGCAMPIAAYANEEVGHLHLSGRVSSSDGQSQIDVQGYGLSEEAGQLGIRLAREALAQGAAKLLGGVT